MTDDRADEGVAPSRDVADLLWSPRSIALIGVSRDVDAVTARPARYLKSLGYAGDVVVVHGGAASEGQHTLHGHPVVANLAELETTPDVAMVLVRAAGVAAALRECAEAGVGGAVVIASGFEGVEAAAARAELHRLRRDHPHFRIVGPNSVGTISTTTGAALTFSTVVGTRDVRRGSIGLVTQSGALGNGLLLGLHERGAGVSQWVSTGDEIDLGALEAAAAMLTRPETRAVGLFLEGIGDGDHFGRLERAIATTGKRVVALKSARSAAGRAAAVGHTGRVVGDGEVADAALAEIGVDVVHSLEQLLETLTALGAAPAPPASLPARVAVVTVSGGAGVLAADEIHQHPQLRLADFDDALTARIGALLPEYVTVANPLDVPVIDDATVFERVLAEVARADGVDATLAVVSALAHDYESLSRSFVPDGTMRVVTHLGPTERFSAEQAASLTAAGVGVLQSPIHAAQALAVWAGHAERPEADGHEDAGRAVLGIAGSAERLALPPEHAPPMRAVTSAADAVAFAAEVGGPVVLKAEGTRITHRSELGAVRVGLSDPDDVASAYEQVAAVSAEHGDEVIAQAMSPRGTEVMVSVVRDPEVGVVAMLRLGGVFVELGTEGVVLTSRREHWRPAVARSALGRVLAGWRGAPPDDLEALLGLVEGLVTAVEADDRIAAVEANPVIVQRAGDPGGAHLVDLATYLASE